MARTPPLYYLHLVAWAQIGVLLRVYLAELFGSACPHTAWAPCLTSSGSRWGGPFFTDLPANIAGSFLMGLFVSSDVLSNSLKHILTVEAPMALLPVRSPLQEHIAFQVGLRTGLCGSLTTFASWLTQMVLMVVGGAHSSVMSHSQWVEALGGLLVGTLAALAALVLGQHCSLWLYHKLNPGAFIPYGSPAPEQDKLEVLDHRQQQQGPGVEVDWSEEPDGLAPRRSSQIRTVSTTRQGSVTVVVVEGQPPQPPQPPQQGAGQTLQSLHSFGVQQSLQGRAPGSQAAAAGSGAWARSSTWQQQQQQRDNSSLPSTVAAGAAAGSLQQEPKVAENGGDAVLGGEVLYETVEEETPSISVAQVVVDGFAALTTATLTAVSLWRIIQGNTGHLPGRDGPFAQEWFWWAILFGPLGCYGRYYLSRFNGKLPADSWRWFPVGTFAANMTACIIDYVLKAVPVRHPMDRVSAAVLAGVIGGVGGCLSTVSTWVVEIQRMLLSFPKTSHGYQYIFISLGTALLLGLVIYGIPVWTMS